MSEMSKHAADLLGSARASRALSGASPQSSEAIKYSKRNLPHFERPWAKYVVAFSTYQRRALSNKERESFDRLIRSESDLKEKFSYICANPWNSNAVHPSDDYRWLWTQEMSSAGAPKTARGARALPKP